MKVGGLIMSIACGARLGFAAAAAMAVALVAGAAAAQPLPPPPLQAGEEILVTANGCAVVYDYSRQTTENAMKNREFVRNASWQGPCRNGLAHGAGKMDYAASAAGPGFSINSEFFFGRGVRIGTSNGQTSYVTEDGRYASATADNTLTNGYWKSDAGTGAAVTANGQSIFASTGLPRTLDAGASFSLYTYRLGESGSGASTDCPDWRTPVGCEALWRQMAGPLIDAYRALRDEVLRTEPTWRANLTRLNAARDARFAALDVASDQAFTRSLAAAQADVARADRAFEARLASVNAGQLYALADELERAGDTGRSGQALRALLTRFPDHPLTVVAAQKLSALPPSRMATGDCQAPAEEARRADALTAARNRLPASDAIGRYEAVLATVGGAAAAWSRCPTHPDSASRIQAYRAVYVETARKCAMISPSGVCAARID